MNIQNHSRVWAPDAVLAPPPGYSGEPKSDTVSFFGAEIPVDSFAPSSKPSHYPDPPRVWAPDAVLAPPPGYSNQPERETVSFFGVQLPPQSLFPAQEKPTHSHSELPRVWAPDAVLAPPPGYSSQPEQTPTGFLFYGY